MNKRKLLMIAALLLIALVFLVTKHRPVVQDESKFKIHTVTLYYNGQPEETITEYLGLDSLELYLQLYKTSIVPTVSRSGQQYDAHYFVIGGINNGQEFTITSDSNGAYLFYHDRNLGYSLHNGDLLKGMVIISAYNEFRNQIQSLAQ